jgi:hypothetical protein
LDAPVDSLKHRLPSIIQKCQRVGFSVRAHHLSSIWGHPGLHFHLGKWSCARSRMHTINQVVMSQLREIDVHTYILYKVSHGKVNKVMCLCWGYTFWFLQIFWIIRVYEIGPFMPSSSVFIRLMLCALYRMISKHSKEKMEKKKLWMYLL